MRYIDHRPRAFIIWSVSSADVSEESIGLVCLVQQSHNLPLLPFKKDLPENLCLGCFQVNKAQPDFSVQELVPLHVCC